MRVIQRATVAAAALLAAGCSVEHRPQATDVQWKIARQPDKKAYRITGGATFAKGLSGWYQPTVTLVDERGCRNEIDLSETQIANAESDGVVRATFDKVLPVPRPVRTAEFNIAYEELDSGQVTHNAVFSEEQTLDGNVHPPANPVNACDKPRSSVGVAHPTRAQLRERAKTDPDGADAQAIDGMGRNELLATAINSAGFLCARVTSMYPRGTDIIAHCVEYRSGAGRVTYRVNAAAGSVEQIE